MRKRPWTDGPWYANFRKIVAYTEDKSHPLRDWPDCDGTVGDGPFQCDDPNCEFSEDCKDEWTAPNVALSVANLRNPIGRSQGDQVVHAQTNANALLIELAPEMAEIVLALVEDRDYLDAAHDVAEKLNKIIEWYEKSGRKYDN